MKVWISYFYAVRFLKPWHIPVSTAVSDPAWFHGFKGKQHVFVDRRGVLNGLRSEKLKPGSACEGLCHGRPCDGQPETCRFLEAYRQQLHSLDLEAFQKSLDTLCTLASMRLNLGHEPEIVLLVHEAPNNPCSERRVLQKVFQCRELDYKKLKN